MSEVFRKRLPKPKENYFEYVEFYDSMLKKITGMSPAARAYLEDIRNDIQELIAGAPYTERTVESLTIASRHINVGIDPHELDLETESSLEEERSQDALGELALRMEKISERAGPQAQLIVSNMHVKKLPTTAVEMLWLLIMYDATEDAKKLMRLQHRKPLPQA